MYQSLFSRNKAHNLLEKTSSFEASGTLERELSECLIELLWMRKLVIWESCLRSNGLFPGPAESSSLIHSSVVAPLCSWVLGLTIFPSHLHLDFIKIQTWDPEMGMLMKCDLREWTTIKLSAEVQGEWGLPVRTQNPSGRTLTVLCTTVFPAPKAVSGEQ